MTGAGRPAVRLRPNEDLQVPLQTNADWLPVPLRRLLPKGAMFSQSSSVILLMVSFVLQCPNGFDPFGPQGRGAGSSILQTCMVRVLAPETTSACRRF